MNSPLLLLLITLLPLLCHSYTAAVVELAPQYVQWIVDRPKALAIQRANLATFDSYLSTATAPLDIAVLGEYALYGAEMPNRTFTAPYAYDLPSPQSHICACTNATWRAQSPVLAHVSCLARKHRAYLVVDLAEQAICGSGGVPPVVRQCRVGVDAVYFNTQVVVDRHGRLVAVYRKSHLYFEPNFDQPRTPDVVWFDTDFGVRFGAIICFDIMFAEPVTSLRRLGISSFVYSTWWVNKAPLINGVQTQAAFARVNNATLIAAGIGVNNQISGSGIYVGNSTLVSTYNQSPVRARSQFLLAQINATATVGTAMPVQPSLIPPPIVGQASNFNIVPFRPSSSSSSVQASQNGTACSFQFGGVVSNNDQFAVVVLDGSYNGLFPLSLCAVVRCAPTGCLDFTLDTSTVFTAWQLNVTVDPTRRVTWYEMSMGAGGAQLGNLKYGRGSGSASIGSAQTSDAFLSATLWGLQW